MAESVLISAAHGILNGLIPLATQQISLAWGFKKDLEKLHRRLTNIQALLRDAERGSIASEAMKNWLTNLKAGTCSAENVLDELAYEALRRKIEEQNQMKNKVRNFFSRTNPSAFPLKMANKVHDINLLLDEICKDANDIGLRQADQHVDASSEPRKHRSTHPFIDDSKLVGRDGDVSAVIDKLLGSHTEDDLPAIAIVGMAGLGKTTLAQLVYKDKKVVESFGDKKIWICVSDDFKVERLLNEMVQSLTGEKSETLNIEGIVRKLSGQLKGKKYLLVLDDVWNTSSNKWVEMRNSLIGIGGAEGSKIVVTTRSMEVITAMQIPSYLTYPLQILSDNDCWTMFTKRVFSSGGL